MTRGVAVGDRLVDWARTEQRRVRAGRELARHPGLLDGLERYCQFIGFPRSGHSLVGALLDAHPDVVIGHETDALRQVERGADQTILFGEILRRERAFVAAGFDQSGDRYEVPGQWQGRVRQLRVIGDKAGGLSSRRLADDPGLLDRLRGVVGVPFGVLVVVRNPYDNIARMARRSNVSLLTAAGTYERMATAVEAALTQPAPDEQLVVRHEDTVGDPEGALRRIATHLGVEAPPDWLAAGASIVLPVPREARGAVSWTPGTEAVVAELVERFAFLAGYTVEG